MRLDEDLFRQVKKVAAERGSTFTDLVDEALRALLARRSAGAQRERPRLPSFRGRGLQPGVDLDDAAALLELMERADESRP